MKYFLAVAGGGAYGMYTYLISLSAKTGINTSLGAVILQITAAVGGVVVALLWPRITGQPIPSVQQIPIMGLLLAVIAGVAVQLAELLSFGAYSRGLPVAVGSLIVVGLQVLVPVILGLVISRETLGPIQLLALILIMSGVVMLTFSK